MILPLRNLSYELRLKDLFSLSKRRMRDDVIEVFKMFKGFSDINAEDHFTNDRHNRTRRNNNYKISGKRFSLHEAKHFFFNQAIDVWNSLPCDVVDSTTVTAFKNRLDKYFEYNQQLRLS